MSNFEKITVKSLFVSIKIRPKEDRIMDERSNNSSPASNDLILDETLLNKEGSNLPTEQSSSPEADGKRPNSSVSFAPSVVDQLMETASTQLEFSKSVCLENKMLWEQSTKDLLVMKKNDHLRDVEFLNIIRGTIDAAEKNVNFYKEAGKYQPNMGPEIPDEPPTKKVKVSETC